MNKHMRISQQLGYQFRDKKLLQQALTHRSAGEPHNERLEFLGDALLSVTIAHALFARYPHYREGELSRLRAALVKGDTLANLARDLGLGDFLILGPGELKSGGHRRASILADTLEALIAAIYLDSDLDTAQAFIYRLYQEKLHDKHLDEQRQDPKTRLQEYLQAKKISLPQYTLTSTSGHDHEQTFFVCCRILPLGLESTGEGPTRRHAEQAAARNVMAQLPDLTP